MELQNLVIEVTRKCNIKCDHCLRGNAQNKVLDTKYIDTLLDQVTYISNLCFTGGEPSLATDVCEYTLSLIKERQIGVGFFFIATNGVNVSEEFVLFCLKLYNYCEDKDMCQIAVSNDTFHKVQAKYSMDLLNGLKFAALRNEEPNYSYYGGRNLISEGRAVDLGANTKLHAPRIKTMEEFNDTEIYLNCKGDIIGGCDWSYTSQNRKSNILCRVENLTQYYESLKE